MQNIAVFPGSFDPITSGHVDLIKRAIPLFEKIVVAIGQNSQKQTLYSLEQRLNFIHAVFEDYTNIEVDTFENLTAHYCKKINANYLINLVKKGK